MVDLQQTPDAAPKVMLRIFEIPASNPSSDPVTYLFHFTSPDDARAEANAIKDLLSKLLSKLRNGDSSIFKPGGESSGTAATTANGRTKASSPSSKGAAAARLFDDNHLVLDLELQESLLKKDVELHQVFRDGIANKPNSVSNTAFNRQFWSTRTGLLRAHAIEANQQRGAYNVLPTMKTKVTQDEETGQESCQLAIDNNQVLQIFNQHPVVKKAYDENVPRPLCEEEFWSRFFFSRLCKQLKGERVADTDRRDPIFDRYDATEDQISYVKRIGAQHVPHIIDVEANEENQGGIKSGNRKDIEMRPRKNVPIIQVLNATSQKLLSNVAPTDGDPEAATASIDEAIWRELSLRDLDGIVAENRIILNIKQQNQFFSEHNAPSLSTSVHEVYESQVSTTVLKGVASSLETLRFNKGGGIDLHSAIGADEQSDEEDEEPHMGSQASRDAAQKQVFEGLIQSRAETYGRISDETTPMGLPKDLAEKAKLTNSTTTEFLRHFWDAFLSGDPDRAEELGFHVESLKRSVQRIEALANEADGVRNKLSDEQRQRIAAHHRATGQRVALQDIGGGREAMMTLFGITLGALSKAQNLYQLTLEKEGITMSTEDE